MRTLTTILATIVVGTILRVSEAVVVFDIPFVGKHFFVLRGGSTKSNASDHAVTEESAPLSPTVASSDPPPTQESNNTEVPSYDFSLLQPGEEIENSVHFQRYLRMQKGNVEKAKHAFEETLEWRKANDVDTTLNRPHPDYDICKRIQVHHFPGRDPSGHIIFIQRPGSLNFDMGEKNNVTKEDLLYHYVWVLEYCWNILEPAPDQIMTNVLDMKGVKFSRVKQYLNFIRKFLGVMSKHYPQRSYKTLVINSPAWTSMAYKLVAPFLRESTRKKISIHCRGKRQDKVLLDIVGKETCPINLLSTSPKVDDSELGVYDSPIETAMREFCLARLEEAGMTMRQLTVEE
mmetsp:Transcript_50322/g.75196  ORF Transcript_50322/g.75196 Transcript_50322/m.75196 type:complete len:346 (-) Transcript_50322:171-1208(-)|eukprot:CAMPEP_0194047678 /NCGR_PEP_ID=MMETSP0009_2-20130614/25110_1 /TAXON_ID=210454 /ORGANISM="Grammatophora oceanica, Strain CCMP 410" /LENGTH=345 /DNA_ID=CAMNT_0038693357 /DNA_START=60 /DNA_END=1097 /DNA_ORIENTATION=-